jgi:hypothetical protein
MFVVGGAEEEGEDVEDVVSVRVPNKYFFSVYACERSRYLA